MIFIFLQIISASMKCRYNNHHHNNNCAYRDDVIKLAIEHEVEYYCKYNPANIKNKEL